MLTTQFGESANDLVKKSKGYRYGFPDFYAAEFPFAPMNYDRSRIYQGVIGLHYPEAQTSRYHYLYDPNMYLQPGFSDADDGRQATSRKIIIGGALGVAALVAVGIFAARALNRSVQRDDWEWEA